MIVVDWIKRYGGCVPPAAALVTAQLIATTPASAGWLGDGIGVAGVGNAVGGTLEEATGIFDKVVSAVVTDEHAAISALEAEFGKVPGKLIVRAFPMLEGAQAVADGLKSAKKRIERFVGGVGTGVADARAALALNEEDSPVASAIVDGEPLLKTNDTSFMPSEFKSPDEVLASLNGESGSKPASSWNFEQWIIYEQEARPHCYGVVDLATLPADCFEPASVAQHSAPGTGDAGTVWSDWASGSWTVEDSGWSGWHTQDARYSDEDREAARISHFAATCWGLWGVSRHEPTYDLMKVRMESGECPNQAADEAGSATSAGMYANALASALGDSSTVSSGSGYLAALDSLEEMEAEQRRLAEEERRREARLAEDEERQLQVRLEKEERERQAAPDTSSYYYMPDEESADVFDAWELEQQQAYEAQVFRNLAESLTGFVEQMNQTYGGSGVYNLDTETTAFDYCKDLPGIQLNNNC